MGANLNIVGAGLAGRTLAALWHRAGRFEIGAVCNRSADSARAAVAFIGSGVACVELDQMGAADVWLIATPDLQINSVAARLAEAGVVSPGNLVFHLSGALGSDALAALRPAGVLLASAHPAHSFSVPQASLEDFSGTVCALEGDVAAVTRLESDFAALGARCVRLPTAGKLLYHAGTVMASNYVVALVEASVCSCMQAGLARQDAMDLLAPLLRNTVERVLGSGTVAALSGPVARGEAGLVAAEAAALDAAGAAAAGSVSVSGSAAAGRDAGRVAIESSLGELYRGLGAIALEIARRQGQLDETQLNALSRALDPDGTRGRN